MERKGNLILHKPKTKKMAEVNQDLLDAQKMMFDPQHQQKELVVDDKLKDENLENIDDAIKDKAGEEDAGKKGEEGLENQENKNQDKPTKNWRDAYKDTDDYKDDLKKQDLAKYEAKMQELAELENDEAIKLVLEARKQGKNPLEFIKEIATADYDKYSPKDLFMVEINKYKDKLSPEQIEAEIEIFDNLSPLQQIRQTENIKNELIAQKKEQLSKFESKPQETPKEVLDNFNKFRGELDSILDKLEGKTLEGVKYTPTLLMRLDKALMDGKVSPKAYINPDGTFDAQEALRLTLSLKEFRGLSEKAKIEAAESKGKEEVLKQRSNVSNGTRTNSMPNSSDSDAELKAAQKEYFNKK